MKLDFKFAKLQNELDNKNIVGYFKLPIRHQKEELIESYLKVIGYYKEAYKKDIFEKLTNEYKVSFFYAPALVGVGGYKTSEAFYITTVTHGSYTTRDHDVDSYEVTYDENDNEVSREWIGSYTETEVIDNTWETKENCSTIIKDEYKTTAVYNPFLETFNLYFEDRLQLTNEDCDEDVIEYSLDSWLKTYDFFSHIEHGHSDFCFQYVTFLDTYTGCKGYDPFVNYYMFFVPVFTLESFDGKHKYLLNAYSGDLTKMSDYQIQEEYIDPEFTKTRNNNVKKLYEDTNKPYKALSIICDVLFGMVALLNGYLLFNELVFKKNYIGYIYEYFGTLRTDQMHTAGIIVFSVFIGVNLLFIFLPLLFKRRNRRGIKKLIEDELYVNKRFRKLTLRLNRRQAFASHLLPLLSLLLCLGASIPVLPISSFGVNKTNEIVTYTDGFDNIQPFYQIKLDLSNFSVETSGVKNIEVPDVCDELYVVGNRENQIKALHISTNASKIHFSNVYLWSPEITLNNKAMHIDATNSYFLAPTFKTWNFNESLTLECLDEESEFSSTYFNFKYLYKDFTLELKNVDMTFESTFNFPKDRNLTIKSSGEGSSITSRGIVAIDAGKVTFDCEAPLLLESKTIKYSPYPSSLLGHHALQCSSFSNIGNALLTIKGGDGLDGEDGYRGSSGKNGAKTGAKGEDGQKGSDGWNGGKGSSAVFVTDQTLTELLLNNVALISGDCGKAGKGGLGGSGGHGADGSGSTKGGNGGNGGPGGNGGTAYRALNPINIKVIGTNVTLTKGKDGIPGEKGEGGYGGIGGYHPSYDQSKYGSDGSRGPDGKVGTLEDQADIYQKIDSWEY